MKTNHLLCSLTGIFICISGALRAQDDSGTYKIKLKLYFNGSYEEVETYNGSCYPDETLKYESKDFDFGTPTLGLEFLGRKRFCHEIELKQIKVTYQDYLNTVIDKGGQIHAISGAGKVSTFQSTVCYHLNYYFLKEKSIMPYIALSSCCTFEIVYKKPPVS